MPVRLARSLQPVLFLMLGIANYRLVTCFQPPAATRTYRQYGPMRFFVTDDRAAVQLPTEESYESQQALLEVVQELNSHLMRYQEAKLLALAELNNLLKELLALKEAYGTVYVAQEQAQDIIFRAMERIESVEKNYLYFWSTQPATITTHRSATIMKAETATDSWLDQHGAYPAGFEMQDEATFLTKQQENQQNKKKKMPKVPAQLYKYARPTAPPTNPGLPSYLGDTLYANLKVAQPALTNEFEKVVSSVTNNPFIVETFKKNQPIYVAELQQFLANLKQNQPIVAARLEQLLVGMKQNQPVLLKQIKQNQPMFSAELEQILVNLKQNQPVFATELEQLLVNLTQNQPIFTGEMEQLLVNLMQNQPIVTAELSQMIVDIKQALLALGGTVI
jgi:hypothetical protein